MFARKAKPNVEMRPDSLHLVESTVKGKNNEDGVKTWSAAIQILLPIAALAILWGRRGFFARFFLQFDKNCVSVFCPSLSKRQRLLKWASGRLPQTWSSHTNIFLDGPTQFWKDGSLLCTLLNSAIPGACSNPHRHWRQPPSHGQALAYKYLGVLPIFTEADLSENVLTSKHERVLFHYLLQVQQAIMKISVQEFKFCSNYVARGMGLFAGEQQRKNTFFIYSNSSPSDNYDDILVSIRGPYNTYNDLTIPARCVTRQHRQVDDKRRLAYQSKAQRSFFRSLSVDFGSFINTTQKQNVDNEIPVKLTTEKERVKIVYIPQSYGIHEISIITNGFHLKGSPFTVNISENTSNKTDTFHENDRLFTKHVAKSIRRRVISKIIDFIDEKVTYENLRAIPMRIRNIPQIKVVEIKDQTDEKENYKAFKSDEPHVNTKEILILPNAYTKESLLKSITEEINKTTAESEGNADSVFAKACLDSSISDSITISATNREDIETESLLKAKITNEENNSGSKKDFAKESLISLQDDDSDTHSDSLFDLKTEQSIKTNLLNSENSDNLCDSNNNKPVFKATHILSDPNTNSMSIDGLPTSPICNDHIAQEVINEEFLNYKESSKIPNGNFKKTPLQKQRKIEIFTPPQFMVEIEHDRNARNSEILNENSEDQPLPENTSTQSETDVPMQNDSKKINDMEGGKREPKLEFLQDETIVAMPRNLKVATDMKEQTSENISKLTMHPNLNSSSELNKNAFPELHSMHILNYISSLKDNTPEYSSTQSRENLSPTSSENLCHLYYKDNIFSEKEYFSKSVFRKRLQYWESQMNLCGSKERYRLKHRSSLPNLFSSSKLISLPPINDELNKSHNFDNFGFYNHNAMEPSSVFRERQEYWKALSSQTVSYSSLSSSLFQLENNKYSKKSKYRNRRSLPNLFSNIHREEIYSQINLLDFYNSPEALQFKHRFKECREYWEKLSTQNLNNEDYYIKTLNAYQQLNYDEDNFDSGFCSSLPNLCVKSNSQDVLNLPTEDLDSLKFKSQYKERREYWERLSSHTLSNASLNHLFFIEDKHQRRFNLESTTNHIGKTTEKHGQKNLKIKESSEILGNGQKERTYNMTNINRDFYNDSHTERLILNAPKLTTKEKEDANLTDDLKSISDQRKKLKTQFHEARAFFRNLEDELK